MLSRSSSLRRAPSLLLLALVGLTLAGLAGCGGDKEVDPFVYTTLSRVMDGDTLSNNFLFEIDAPQIDYAKGDVAMVRSGNRIEFMVGPDIEHAFAGYAGMLLGVEKRFSPTTHLFLKRTKQGEIVTPVDSVESYALPAIFMATRQQLETPGADLSAMNWRRKSTVESFLPAEDSTRPIEVQSGIAEFVYVPRHDLSEEQAANPGPDDFSWYAIFPESSFQLVDLNPGANWMLQLLKDKNLPLVGSFTLTEYVEAYSDRAKTHGDLGHVIGKMRINWFRYANSYVRGAV